MGKDKAGKTSMHSIIFANCPSKTLLILTFFFFKAKDANKIGMTIERNDVKL